MPKFLQLHKKCLVLLFVSNQDPIIIVHLHLFVIFLLSLKKKMTSRFWRDQGNYLKEYPHSGFGCVLVVTFLF